MRIGEGWDTHALVPGRKLMLGGVRSRTPMACSAIRTPTRCATRSPTRCFGAAALGDIGRHFPDTDAQFKGADSLALLAEAARRVRGAGWQIGNVDSTVIAQAPKLAPHIRRCASASRRRWLVEVDQVNVKAKTAEKMGPVGQGEAMEARAVCLLASRDGPAPASHRSTAWIHAARFRRIVGDQPAIVGVGQLERAAHALHRLLDDRQAQAGAGGRGARGVAAEERRGQLAELVAGRRPGRGRAR